MKTPRPDQIEAIDALLALDRRGLSVRACGTGKTLVGREVARRRTPPGGVIAVFVPSKALVRQMYHDWAAEWPDGLDALLVYSDPGVGATPATTEPEAIADFIRTRTGRTRLIVSTYQSAERVADAYADDPGLPPLDVMVLDEVHVTAGPAGKPFALVLDDDRTPANFRAGLTATARVHPGGDGTQDVASMDDPERYGERIPDLTFGQAIQKGLLNDYVVAVVVVTDRDVHQVLLDQAAMPGGRELSTSQIAAQIAVARAIKQYGSRRILGFHNRVERSQSFTATFARTARRVTDVPVQALHIDGTSSHAAREAGLNMLAHPWDGGATVLSNVSVLTVGVDVPAVDTVVFAEPRTSRVNIAQAVGRALRLHPGKDKKSVLVLPVYIAPGENPEQVLAASEFQHVYGVLSALRDFDERMDSAFTVAAMQLGEAEFTGEESTAFPSAIEILGLDEEIHGKMHDALRLQVLTNTVEPWTIRYGKLKAYMAFTGAMPPAKYISPQGDALGAFVQTQQAAHNSGTLLPSRKELLEQLPGWAWREKRVTIPKIDDEKLTELASEFHNLLSQRNEDGADREATARRLIAIAYEVESMAPKFKIAPHRYRAFVNNAALSMQQLWQRAEAAKNKNQNTGGGKG